MAGRYAGQHGRKAFGVGRKVAKASLARAIADSIRTHAAHGVHREVTQYTGDFETQRLVGQLLAA